MKIVIDVPKTIYTNIKSSFSIKLSDANTDKVIKAIKNGTPLPKGHGDLIDRDKLEIEEIGDVNCYSIRQIDDAVAVVKADRGDVDGNS